MLHATIRLPAPPPPPKPLHLTISTRGDKDKKSSYPQMPSWSRESSESGEPEEEGGTVRGGRYAQEQSQEEEEGWTTARSRPPAMPSLNDLFLEAGGAEELDAPHYARRTSRRVPSGFSEGGKSTRGTLKGSSSTIKRNSIYFAPRQPNPFVPPALPPSPSLPPSPIVEPTDTSEPAEEPQEDDDDDEANLLDLPPSLPALSLHSFAGEAAFGELSFDGGVELCIEVEDLGGGWSLGFEKEKGEDGRGLIPRGWYAYIEQASEPKDLTRASPSASAPSTPPPSLSSPPPSLPTPPPPLPPDSPPASTILISPFPLSTSTLPASPSPPLPSQSPPPSPPDSLPPPSPPPGGRSIGRSIIISGIEFEPTDSLPSTPAAAPQMFSPSIPDWLLSPDSESEARVSPVLTVGEMEGFFAGSREAEEGSHDVEEVHEEVVGQTPEHRLETSEDTLRSFADVAPFPPIDLAARFHIVEFPEELVTEMELEMTLAPVLEEEEEEGETDTQEAREARWAAVVDSAEQSASSASLTEEDESGFPWTPPPPCLASSVAAEPLAAEPPVAKDVLSRTSTMLFRLGLGTVGRGYSVTSIGLGTRSASGRSVSGTLRANGKGKGLVQDWILRGDAGGTVPGDTACHIDSGPAWRHDSPPFTVHVHSPEKRSSTTAKADYTVFQLTTVFSPSEPEADESPLTMTVERRYSHFTLLHALLVERYPVVVVPQVPVKSYAGRFQEQFVETRRRDLERWCARIGRHAVLGSADEVREFLGIESDAELRSLLIPSKSTSPSPTAFFARVFHPEFNVDPADARDILERFEKHAKAIEVGGGVKDVEMSVGRVREGIRDHAANLRALAHSIVRLVAGLALPPVTSEEKEEDDALDQVSNGERDRRRALALCVLNEDGALTWKEGCEGSLSLAKAVQATAESVAAVAELYDTNAQNTLLPVQELLRESAYPYSQHAALIETYKVALSQHQELTDATPLLDAADSHDHEEAISRAETILNITSAEIERIDSERNEDLQNLSTQYLQGQIDFHEQALTHLRFARTHFEPTSFHALAHTGPRLRSLLEQPPTSPRPLPVPSNYGIPTSVLGVSSSLGRPVGVVGEVLSETVENVLGLRGVAPVVYRARGSATAGTVGRSAVEILRGREEGRATWRQGIFGSSRLE